MPPSGRRSPAMRLSKRGLASAVGPDDAEGLALGNIEREVIDHPQRAEALADVVYLQQCRHTDMAMSAQRLQRAIGRDLGRQRVVGDEQLERELATGCSSATAHRPTRSG